MSTVILSGTTLLEYVQQAQNICGTDFPIIGLNRQYHIEPSKTFNSLPHTEVDIIPLWALFSPFAFQLTTSHRGRRRPLESRSNAEHHFNSLPHTEVDHAITSLFLLLHISTHYLTQR